MFLKEDNYKLENQWFQMEYKAVNLTKQWIDDIIVEKIGHNRPVHQIWETFLLTVKAVFFIRSLGMTIKLVLQCQECTSKYNPRKVKN